MSVKFTKGDMFVHPGEAIVNTVNCVGVMGKGVALEFKKRWPGNFTAYRRLCDAGALRPGKVFIHELDGPTDMFDATARRWLVNFPTKDHWRDPSRIEYITEGLDDLVLQVRALGIRSIVIPPLGCGNGGLKWSDVRPEIERRLALLQNMAATVFEP